jgi:hypothetical protein
VSVSYPSVHIMVLKKLMLRLSIDFFVLLLEMYVLALL